MDFNGSDAEFEIELSHDPNEDRDVLRKTRQSIGLSRDYVPGWNSRDAFREFYQNWMDGMIDTHKVLREDVIIDIKENGGEWVATAHRPISHEMMGFIRFDKLKSILELTNFNAQLSRKALDIGSTSKRHAAGQAGEHGEGFKVASLVMVRKDYQVRSESAKYYWSFQFGGRDKRHLYCHLTPMSDNKVTKRMLEETRKRSMGQPKGLKGNIWEDVTVQIGKVYGTKGKKVEFDKFQDWIKVSLALNRPSQMVKTANGDLVLSKDFGGRMYLKGLYLSEYSGTKTLKFGYNLYQGTVDRDRQQMGDFREQAKTLAKIWAEAIEKKEAGAVKEYTRMMREEDAKQKRDVSLARENMTRGTAEAIWKEILEGDLSPLQFFYDKKTEAEDVATITKCLKRQPVSLPTTLWESLRKYDLVRTPEEQRSHKLQNALPSELEHTAYSEALKRSLKAILALDDRTKDLITVFKSGANADLDLLLEGSNLLINDKWLDFMSSHLKAPCWLSRYGVMRNEMPCDHIITRLYDLILRELTKGPTSKIDRSAESKDSLRLQVSDSLRQMPRMIEVSQSQKPKELIVTWTMLEKDLVLKMYGLDLRCQVTLHRESTCAERKADIVFYNTSNERDVYSPDSPNSSTAVENEGFAKCGCSFQVVSQGDSGVVFQGLDPEEKYFPMVSRDYDQAFFGVPPEAVRPAVPKIGPQPPHLQSNSGPETRSTEGLLLTPSTSQCTATLPNRSSSETDSGVSNYMANHNTDNTEFDDGQEAEDSSSMQDNENSQESEIPKDKAIVSKPSAKPEVSKKLMAELKAVEAKFKSERQSLRSASYRLQQQEQELATAVDSLENKDIELRQAKASRDAQKQRFENIIENLEGEIQRLQETHTEIETRRIEHCDTIAALQTELQKAQAKNNDIESGSRQSTDIEMSGASEGSEGTAKSLVSACQSCEVGAENRRDLPELEQRNFDLQKRVQNIKADHDSVNSTLQALSGIVQGVLKLQSREAIITTLQGVLGMIQGVLSQGTRAQTYSPSIKREGVKRERVNDENDNYDDLYSSHPKRRKQAEPIDLTE